MEVDGGWDEVEEAGIAPFDTYSLTASYRVDGPAHQSLVESQLMMFN